MRRIEETFWSYFAEKNFEKSSKFAKKYIYSPQPVKVVLNKLNNPQNSFKSIHVAGTVGKGSCTYLLSGMLLKSGVAHKVGSFFSPHLQHINERIQCNNIDISDQSFQELWEIILSIPESQNLSFFDTLTIIAFLYFQKEQVDWAVIETGLGGRYDSTNNLVSSLCVITRVAKDHVNVLGDTLAKIAFEKSGIIKPHTPVYVFPQTQEVLFVLQQEAKIQQSHLVVYKDNDEFQQVSYIKQNQWFCMWLFSNYFQRPVPHISYNLHGRLECLRTHPKVYFDSGHNEAGIYAVTQWMKQISDKVKWIIYINTLLNRRLEDFIEVLNHHVKTEVKQIILFPMDGKRFYTKQDIISHKLDTWIVYLTSSQIKANILEDTTSHHLFIGSMYMYNEVLKCLAPCD